MSEYRFMNQLIEKEQIPTPAYVFDLDEMKEFAEKVKRCLTGKAEICYAMKANPFLIKSMMEIVYAHRANFEFVKEPGFQWRKLYFQVYTKIRMI